MIDVQTELSCLFDSAEPLIRRVVECALASEQTTGDVCVLITDAEEMEQLNAHYRNIRRATDVLTFPAWEGDEILCPPDGYLGDIAICYERAVEQAEEFGHSIERELAFLAVHGALHLLGYDHITPEGEEVMLRKQNDILTATGYTR